MTEDPVECDGGIGVCEIPRLQELMDVLCQNGFEHYVAMNRGFYVDVVKETLGKHMEWEVHRHR